MVDGFKIGVAAASLADSYEYYFGPRPMSAIIRTYRDNKTTRVYVRWSDGAETQGSPKGAHIQALLTRLRRERKPIHREVW